MKQLFVSLLFIAAALFVTDRLGGKIMNWVVYNTQDVTGPKISYLFEEVHEEVLLLGTSRCNLHYVPSILEDSLQMSVYNGGIDGSNCIFSHYIVLNHMLERHRPKVISLEVMTNDYKKEPDAFEATSFFAPYFGRNQSADSVYREAGTSGYYRLSHLYRFNAKAVSNLAGLLLSRQADGEQGYIPNPEPRRFPDMLRPTAKPASCDSLKLEYLERFIARCREKEIALVFTISPAYSRAEEELYGPLKQLAARHRIPVFDYHSAGLFHDHPEYFKDNSHLWDKGARRYTQLFAHDLKRYLDSVAAGNAANDSIVGMKETPVR